MATSLKELPPDRIIETEHGEIYVYSMGIASASVCAPEILEGEGIASYLDKHRPGDVVRKWRVASPTSFPTGESNPCRCNQDDERLHWMFLGS